MNEDPSPAIEPLLDEGVAAGEMLEDVVIVHVIDWDDVMLEVLEEMSIERRPQDGDYMRDVGLVQGVFAP